MLSSRRKESHYWFGKLSFFLCCTMLPFNSVSLHAFFFFFSPSVSSFIACYHKVLLYGETVMKHLWNISLEMRFVNVTRFWAMRENASPAWSFLLTVSLCLLLGFCSLWKRAALWRIFAESLSVSGFLSVRYADRSSERTGCVPQQQHQQQQTAALQTTFLFVTGPFLSLLHSPTTHLQTFT